MFLWCHVRHINPSKEHPERIRKIDKKLVKYITNPEEIREEDKKFIGDLMMELSLLYKKKILTRLW